MSGPARILVTGASGFVGRLLTPALAARFPASAILALGGEHAPEFGDPRIQTARFSLLEEGADDVALFDPAPDLVIHLAARSSVAASARAAFDTMTTNLGGTMRLAELVRRHAPGAAIVFASTGEVYGATFLDGPAKESSPTQPRSPYARSKTACEYALADMLGDAHRVVNLRLFNHTGPGQDERFVAPSFAAQIVTAERGGERQIRVGNLSAQRDFLDVRDVVSAYLKVCGDIVGQGPGVETFNVCSGKASPIQSILDGLLALAKTPVEVTLDPARLRPSDIPRAEGDGSLFADRYGWRPTHDLADTLHTVLEYWRSR